MYTFTTFDDILRDFYYFDRPFKENRGFESRRLENGNGLLLLNVLGIDANDLEINVEASQNPQKNHLVVRGTTEVFGKKFEVSYDFLVSPVKTITPTLKNGILSLEIEWNKPVAPDVEIKAIQ